jgi:hypothetical protein
LLQCSGRMQGVVNVSVRVAATAASESSVSAVSNANVSKGGRFVSMTVQDADSDLVVVGRSDRDSIVASGAELVEALAAAVGEVFP